MAILGFGAIVVSPPEKVPAGSSLSLRRQCTVESVRLVEYGTIVTPAKTDAGQRLQMIYEDLHTLVGELDPDLVAIEKLFFHRMSTTIPVAQARGVLMLVLAQTKRAYVEYTPPQIKQAIAGYGNAKKIEVQEAVTRELNLAEIPRPDDAADALAVAIAAHYLQPESASAR